MHISVALYRLLAKQFADEAKEQKEQQQNASGSISAPSPGSIDNYMAHAISNAKSMMPKLN